METTKTKKIFAPWVWWPLLALGVGVVVFLLLVIHDMDALVGAALVVLALLYFLIQTLGRLVLRQWRDAGIAAIRLICLVAGLYFFVFPTVRVIVAFNQLLGPSEDHFADNLVIPEGIDIAIPIDDVGSGPRINAPASPDPFQAAVLAALAVQGNSDTEIIPALPSLRRAATEHAEVFFKYLEASPDWHVFMESGHRFAARRWSRDGIPLDTLHGYISDTWADDYSQMRCLLCLDCKQWSGYSVQHIQESANPAQPRMSRGNGLDESRIMIDCGKVWVELFEQSSAPERRITKAAIGELEKEFARFLDNPEAAVNEARLRSAGIASRIGARENAALILCNGIQPGIYVAHYRLNPGAPGSVYLKAFEVTQGTPLSAQRLREKSETRMAWSANPEERFSASARFTIYEGDWGKPYAARFEVWFKPDDGSPERKLAERIFKIEGWQR